MAAQNMRPFIESGGRAVQVFQPPADAVYDIESASHMARVPRRTILVYCRHHLVSPVEDTDGYYFDNEAICRLRNIEYLRARFGVNIAGIKFILRLLSEMDRLRYEQQFFAE